MWLTNGKPNVEEFAMWLTNGKPNVEEFAMWLQKLHYTLTSIFLPLTLQFTYDPHIKPKIIFAIHNPTNTTLTYTEIPDYTLSNLLLNCQENFLCGSTKLHHTSRH